MTTPNKERQRKWRRKRTAAGMRTVTVMLPADIKDLIDRKRKECGATIAQIVETAVVNWLSDSKYSDRFQEKNRSKQEDRNISTEKMQQMCADLKAITTRFEELAGLPSGVTCNEKTVTNDVQTHPPSEAEDPLTIEIYRLVRLLNNMEVSPDEIALTLNKRKYKTLSGTYEWNAGDVQTILEDIHQKYGHINPLFSISHNP